MTSDPKLVHFRNRKINRKSQKMIFLTSRSKCFPQLEFSTHNGTIVNSAESNENTIINNRTTEQRYLQTPETSIGFHQLQTNWIRTDPLLSEANLIHLPHILTPITMTKTMDSFSDARNNTMTPNSMAGFDDELMTPIIDPLRYDEEEKEMACTWIDVSHDNLNKDDFLTCFNSPPESVKSHTSNDDSDCINNNYNNNNFFNNTSDDMMFETEKSFDFSTFNALEPMKHSQDFLYPGANGFHDEIEQVSNEHTYSISNTNIDLVKNEHDIMMENGTPILGDVMLSRQSGFKFKQQIIKNEQNNTDEMMSLSDVNSNNMQNGQKLLAKRNQPCLPRLQLKVKVCSFENGITTIDDKVPAINPTNTVISTPQITKDILDMEHDFDLVNYIVDDNDKSQATTNMVEINLPKSNVEEIVSIPKIEQILPTPVASPISKPINNTTDDEIQLVSTLPREKRTSKRRAATRNIAFFDEIQPKRPRGRPPKTEPTKISPAEYKRLNSSDRKYLEMRLKNNEASRRSRLNRKGKEEALFDELYALEKQHQELQKIDAHLDIQCEKWRKKLIKLAQL